MKQTAVEWLVEQITGGTIPAREAIQQAKEMEMKQIMDAYSKGHIESSWGRFAHSEQYYKETFKQQDNDTRTQHD